MLDLFLAVRRADLPGLPDGQAEPLLRMQAVAQQRQLALTHPGHRRYVVLEAGTPAGVLVLSPEADRLWVLDLAIHPGAQGHGLGRRVLETVLTEATEAGRPVALHVRADNARAIGLYSSLGFEVVAASDLDLRMEWSPRQARAADGVSLRTAVGRRCFVVGTAVVAAAAGGLVAAAPADASVLAGGDSHWTRSLLAPRVGQGFLAYGGSRRLRLTAVRDLPYVPAGMSARQHAAYREENFVARFALVSGPALPADAGVVSHRALGRTRMFLTPRGSTSPARHYEAVYNRKVVT